jgi:ATP-dependent DNA ligase
MGLEGDVSKKLSAPYRSGRSTDWLKIKNPDSPAMIRAREVDWEAHEKARRGVAEQQKEPAFCRRHFHEQIWPRVCAPR